MQFELEYVFLSMIMKNNLKKGNKKFCILCFLSDMIENI